MHSYALSKTCNERTARDLSLRNDTDIHALRVGDAIEPNERALFPGWFAAPARSLA